MTVEELFELVRDELDDVAQPYKWSEEQLLDYLVDAENEACRRARLLLSSTQSICTVAVTAGTALYSLDARVIQVNRVQVVGEDRPLCPAMQRDLDEWLPEWRTETSDPPIYWCPDYEARSVLLVGNPESDLTLNMTVEHLPMVPVDQGEDELNIPAQYHRNLRHWMMHRAYSVHDSEVNNEAMSDKCLAMFEREFGQPQPAYNEQWVEQHYMGAWVGRY